MNKQLSEYVRTLEEHIQNVKIAGQKIGVDAVQLAVHDQSKFTDEELLPYAKYFFDEDGSLKKNPTEKERMDFSVAWLHHLNKNKHHWEYWLIPNGRRQGKEVLNTALEMPKNFALEMIADWMGASKTYNKSWDLSGWLTENVPYISLHPETAEYVTQELIMLGYDDIFEKVAFNEV